MQSVSYSPDGKLIVTDANEMTVHILDAVTGKSLFALKGHADNVTSAAYSPDGKRIVTGSFDKTARLWQRRRPEYWWGVAWLPEFWLTLALGLGLLWSVWRDRKGLKTSA